MIKDHHIDSHYSYNSKYITGALSLRLPQEIALEHFARFCDIISFRKRGDITKTPSPPDAEEFYREDLLAVKEHWRHFQSFERDFPSVCFALATGIGKTRLMGACIAYLRYEKGVKNFFVMAPNLTIYKKLRDDLGNPSNPKYVFKGLDLFVSPPRIIDGDNYHEFRQRMVFSNDVTINIFNVDKLNSDSKTEGGKPARIKRINEILGESYFSYLQSLDDLCIFMDESHHYHADKSFAVINELRPLLGVELTATPQIQKGQKKIPFKNILYEYNLAHALMDGKYVKEPVVYTRKDFRPEEYTAEQLDHEKLFDGLRIHEDIKGRLEVYARSMGKPIVKPFVLVVAKDTEHSNKIKNFIQSAEFFDGYYADKVMEINSSQRGAEKDENIELLLSLEKPDNRIEIVIHVNMLKEGWDVSNLYTIIPLRASASETLTEQTIGRGLRLPYGERTGVAEIDRLNIISHDKYEAVVKLANDPNSIVRRTFCIDEQLLGPRGERETVELPDRYGVETSDDSLVEQLALELHEGSGNGGTGEEVLSEEDKEITQYILTIASQSVAELDRQVRTFSAVSDPATRQLLKQDIQRMAVRKFPHLENRMNVLSMVIEKSIDACVQTLTKFVIPIPQARVEPLTERRRGYHPFKLDTRSMNWRPSGDILMGTEVKEGGETFELNLGTVYNQVNDTPENKILRHIIVHDNVDYASCADLLYQLIGEARLHFLSYLSEEDAIKVMEQRQTSIADIIYAQMRENFYIDDISYKVTDMRPFSRIETGFGGKIKADEIYELNANIEPSEIRHKIFKGFQKACHTLYKFDSDTERTLAIVLEGDANVLKWMRPAPKQFNIYYSCSDGERRYEPDFVVETANKIYMVETKASNELEDKIVKEKARAARKYCETASCWNRENDGKPWEYVLISHHEVRRNSSFKSLVENSVLNGRKEQPLI